MDHNLTGNARPANNTLLWNHTGYLDPDVSSFVWSMSQLAFVHIVTIRCLSRFVSFFQFALEASVYTQWLSPPAFS